MMKKFGLIGFPLGHSFSKSYFKEKFDNEGIEDAVYENYPLENIEAFEELYKNDPDLKGVNVTIPYKESIIPYLDVLSQGAREVQAVNTVCLCTKTGKFVKVGHNTDIIGFQKSLEESMPELADQAIVLGTGGSSKAVVYVLEDLGIKFTRVSSSGAEGAVSYNDISPEMIKSSQLIVNTTPLGMHPQTEALPAIPYEYITRDHLLFDLIYNPEETEFLKQGIQRGAKTVNGMNMLAYQAEAAWEIWNR